MGMMSRDFKRHRDGVPAQNTGLRSTNICVVVKTREKTVTWGKASSERSAGPSAEQREPWCLKGG